MKSKIALFARLLTVLASAAAVVARPNEVTLGVFIDIFSFFVLKDTLSLQNRKIGMHVAACWLLIVTEIVRIRCEFSLYLRTINFVLNWLDTFPFPKLQSMGLELQSLPFREIVAKVISTYGFVWLFACVYDLMKYSFSLLDREKQA